MNAHELRAEGRRRAGILLLGVLLGGGFVRAITPAKEKTPPKGLRYEIKFKDAAKPSLVVVGTSYSWGLIDRDCLRVWRSGFLVTDLVFDSCGVASIAGTEQVE